MATTSRRAHKHFQLDSVKIKRAQKALRAKTETETIERAFDLAISRNTKAIGSRLEANERFLRSGGRDQGCLSANWIARCRAALFDSSIYISGMRQGNDASLVAAAVLGRCSALAQCGGARGTLRRCIRPRSRGRWNDWSAILTGVKRILVPNLTDWTRVRTDCWPAVAAKYHYENDRAGTI